MKSLILFGIAFFAMSHCFAQKSLDQFIHRFADSDRVNNLNLQGSLLQLAGNIATNSQGKRTLNKLNKLTAMWFDDFNPVSKKEINYLLKNLRKDHFESLIMMKDGTSNVNFLVQENGKDITGVILLINDEDQFLLINLQGQLRYEDLNKLDLDVDGMEYFNKLPKDRSALKRA